ncbi:MAG: MAPEG family protein [Wenzhouxiangella sp.]
MTASITLFYAALCGLILIILSVKVVALRRRHQVGIGDGEQADLERAIRVQGNFVEYVPIGLLLLLLLELGAVLPGWLLHVLGASLVLARMLHGFWGLNRTEGVSRGRFLGTLLTWSTLIVASLIGLWLALGHWLFLGGA